MNPDDRMAAAIVSLLGAALARAQDGTEFQKIVKPFFETHCVRCHGTKKQKGDLRLDRVIPDFDSTKSAGIWIEVMDNLNLGEMPPEDEPRPDSAAHRRIVRWIASGLRAAEKRAAGAGGRVALRRLNRTEFSNTIRDLLGMRFLPGDDPAEPALPRVACSYHIRAEIRGAVGRYEPTVSSDSGHHAATKTTWQGPKTTVCRVATHLGMRFQPR